MGTRSKKGIIAALIAWCVLLAIGGVAYRYVIAPMLNQQKEQQEEESLIADTSASSNYDHTVTLYADGFSGYSILRSPEFRQLLKNEKIRLDVIDDQANYQKRMQALESDKADFAVFPINSFIQAGAKLGSFPATIVLVIDETQGADAIVAYKQGLAALQDLDNPEARIVYTPDSPSEFLAEVTIESFIFPRLSDDWRIKEQGSEEVFERMKGSSPNEPTAYVLWEPQVSESLELGDVHVLLDSSKMRGYIMDVLVVNREFLREHPDVANIFVEMYCRALYLHQSEGSMVSLVQKDAGPTGKLSVEHAENIVNGISWKNTTDNYGYFGVIPSKNESLEDIVTKITKIMIQVGMLKEDPLDGNPTTILFDRIFKGMKADGFHPRKKLNIIATDLNLPAEAADSTDKLRALSDPEWQRLRPVANFHVEQIRFPRMSAKITLQNERKLTDLAQRLQDWPSYYITIRGQSLKNDNAELDAIALELAEKRARTAADFLIANGIPSERLRVEAKLSDVNDWSVLNLLFEAGQIPY